MTTTNAIGKAGFSVGAQIRALRYQRRESLAALAVSVGTSRSYLFGLESGRRNNPGADLLVRLARHFGCSIDFLVGVNSIEQKIEEGQQPKSE